MILLFPFSPRIYPSDLTFFIQTKNCCKFVEFGGELSDVKGAPAFSWDEIMYFRESVAAEFLKGGSEATWIAGYAVHEGQHIFDEIFRGGTMWSVWKSELSAYFTQSKFLTYKGIENPWPTKQSVRKHIRREYPLRKEK